MSGRNIHSCFSHILNLIPRVYFLGYMQTTEGVWDRPWGPFQGGKVWRFIFTVNLTGFRIAQETETHLKACLCRCFMEDELRRETLPE